MIVQDNDKLIKVPDNEAQYYTKVEYPKDLKDVRPQDFDFVDNEFVFNLDKYNHRLQEDDLELLRLQRNEECFPIINRGKLWYDTLTEEQVIELNKWYQSWLNVTETKFIPTKPSWLN